MIRTRMWILLCFFAAVSFAAEARPFKVLTWNVYMLPRPVKFSNQKLRIQLIARKLLEVDHDIVVLQEAFSDKFRGTVSARLAEKFPYQMVLGKSGNWKQVMNSGLMVLSKFPFRLSGYDYYSACAGADCFASKGFLMVDVEVDRQVVQLGVTHLQSGGRPGMAQIRESQLLQIKSLMDSSRLRGVPQILVGDLNVDALRGDEFGRTLTLLEMTSAPLSGYFQSSKSQLVRCLGQRGNATPEWLDHFLVRSNGSEIFTMQKRAIPLQDFVKGQWCDLSDHYPVEAGFSF